ncbi:MAG: hypothetical protein AB8B87_02290 [Granulosicoccus sp.]
MAKKDREPKPIGDTHVSIELFGRGGVDPMKSHLTIALGRKDAIDKQW